MNPLMQKMGAVAPAIGSINPQAIQQVKQMMGAFKAIGNPQEAIMQAAQQNPQLNAVLQMCQGRNPKDVFYEQCQKIGVNPDDIIKQLM